MDRIEKEIFLERLASLTPIIEPNKILGFLMENDSGVLESALLRAVEETRKEPYLKRMDVSFFECPLREGSSIYINADFNIPDYASVYRIEERVFEKALQPDFKALNFKILLSFDNIE